MTRRLAAVALALACAGCRSGGRRLEPIPPADERPKLLESPLPKLELESSEPESRRELGPVLLVERRGSLYIDQVNVVLRREKDRALVGGIVAALFANTPLLSRPNVQTLDEYIGGIERAEKDRPLDTRLDLAEIRRELERDLLERSAVVYRYISTREKEDGR